VALSELNKGESTTNKGMTIIDQTFIRGRNIYMFGKSKRGIENSRLQWWFADAYGPPPIFHVILKCFLAKFGLHSILLSFRS
jgi:hypothetical protein